MVPRQPRVGVAYPVTVASTAVRTSLAILLTLRGGRAAGRPPAEAHWLVMTTVGADAVLAAELARAAGRMLMTLRAEMGFDDPRALRDEGDRRSHELITAALADRRPGDAVLSEEGKDDLGRLTADRVWIVDPLDGTREFGEPGRTDWAVHVALWAAGGTGSRAGEVPGRAAPAGDLVAAAVALPAAGLVFCTEPPPVPAPPAGGPARIVASRSRAPAVVDEVTSALAGQKLTLGSAGAKAMAILRGEADVYVHAGGLYEWDSAAPVAVARAAGLHPSRIDGSPLIYTARDPLLPDLLVCRAEYVRDVLAVTRPSAGDPL